jgi:hypothetical protein
MLMNRAILCLALPAMLAAAASSAAVAEGPNGSDLATLAAWMSGSFSSAAQAGEDEDFRDVRLRVTPIWTERDDGPWLYVEQAMATTPDRPYRQRVYQVADAGDGRFESRIFLLPEPAALVGAGADPSRFGGLSPAGLVPRTGCTVTLRREGDDAFAGSTSGRACPSELRGAAYATSEVRITPREMRSWDRGFDVDGKQVWGAEKGPYVFVREASDATSR